MEEIKEKDQMEKFIEFIVDLVNDEWCHVFEYRNAGQYFMDEGSFLFVHIIKHYIKEVKIVANPLDHFAIEYKGQYYNSCGKTKDLASNCHGVLEYTSDEKETLNKVMSDDGFGMAIIKELDNCSGNPVKKLVNRINSKAA